MNLFGNTHFPGNLSFHLHFKIYLQKDVHNIPLLAFKSLLPSAVISLPESNSFIGVFHLCES